MTLTPGTLLNERYRIVAVLGQGGMGSVYRAIDEKLHTSVAVKENLFLAEEYTRQFQREASILASLRHPNLPRVGDYSSIPGQGQYLIMDFVEGEDLRKRIERLGTLPEKDVVITGMIICDALTYLHTRQPSVIHRDIKPGNIKITPEGDVYLVDFGLAKVAMGPQATITGARAMTPGYSPPEQYGTARTDARSDIYSLGATLYAALTGSIPEDGLERITGKSRLIPLTTLNPSISPQLAETIEKALEVDTDDRYQTADEFKEALLEAAGLSHLQHPKIAVSPPPIDVLSPNNEEGIFQPLGGDDGKIFQKAGTRAACLPITILAIIGVVMVVLSLVLPGQPGKNISQLFIPVPITNTASPTTYTTPGVATVTKTPSPSQTSTLVNNIPTDNVPVSPTSEVISNAIGGGNGEIAFASDRSGIMQIWIMNVDGSYQRQLTSIEKGACQPSWSPDGQQIAFISPCAKKSTYYEGTVIYIMNADGSDIQPLNVTPSLAGDFDPAWSPDGKRMAFTSLRTGTRHIFVVNLEDGQPQEISNTPYADMHPSWDPGGKQLAFARFTNKSSIWVAMDTGRYSSQFTESGNFNDLWPAWSPSGDLIFFSQSDPKGNAYWLVSLKYEDRGTTRELRIVPPGWSTTTFPIMEVDISKDGEWLVLESNPDGRNHDIYMLEVDGKNQTRLTTDPGFDFGAVWRP